MAHSPYSDSVDPLVQLLAAVALDLREVLGLPQAGEGSRSFVAGTGGGQPRPVTRALSRWSMREELTQRREKGRFGPRRSSAISCSDTQRAATTSLTCRSESVLVSS